MTTLTCILSLRTVDTQSMATSYEKYLMGLLTVNWACRRQLDRWEAQATTAQKIMV